MIEKHYNLTAEIQRMADESGETEGYSVHLSDIPCHVQPLEAANSQDISGSFGKDWLMFCPVSDILDGDRVIIGENEYRVVGVESYEFQSRPRHMELTIRKFTN